MYTQELIAGSYGSSIFSFWEIAILFSTVAAPVYIPNTSIGGFLFLHTFSDIIYVLFGDSHPDRCEVISHCCFNLYFPGD